MSQPDLVVRWKNSEGLENSLSATASQSLNLQDACDEYLQLRLNTNGLASGIEIGSSEGSGAEV
jgi:hypothetical protein